LRPDEPVVILRLHDSGPGIPEDQLRRIFDPFFTTKAVGSGTGLGLSVVKRIIDLHGGCIHFQNSPLGGLEVILAFAALAPAIVPSPAGQVLMAH
jgi:signal transduction histidine kinase